MKKPRISVTLCMSAFLTDFYINAEIEIESFGSPEFIPPYNRPDLYDPGCGPEWSVVVDSPLLFLDCGGSGEPVRVGSVFSCHLADFITTDKAMIEQVEEAIAKAAKEDAED